MLVLPVHDFEFIIARIVEPEGQQPARTAGAFITKFAHHLFLPLIFLEIKDFYLQLIHKRPDFHKITSQLRFYTENPIVYYA